MLEPIGEELTVSENGGVWQGARSIGRLALVDFPRRDGLVQESHGYWAVPPEWPRYPATAEVHQGALEASNVSAVDEMVALIQTQRSFQAGGEILRLISQSYERLNQFR